MVLRDAGDHLLDQHGLAHAGAAEQADLAAEDVRREQVDDLDAGLEHLGLRLELVEGGRLAVDAPPLVDLVVLAVLEVEDVTGRVEDVALGDVTHGDRDRTAGVGDRRAADHAVGRPHRDRAHDAVADVLGDLERDLVGLTTELHRDLERVVDLRHRVRGELDVDDGADDPGDPAAVRRALLGGVLLVDRGGHVVSRQS